MEFCTATSSLHQEVTQELPPAAAGGTTSFGSAVASVLFPSAYAPSTSMFSALHGESLVGCAKAIRDKRSKARVEINFMVNGFEAKIVK
jgi:hypothetical protein